MFEVVLCFFERRKLPKLPKASRPGAGCNFFHFKNYPRGGLYMSNVYRVVVRIGR